MDYFEEEMLRLIANPQKLKSKKRQPQDLFFRELVYKFKEFKITRTDYAKIQDLIQDYLETTYIQNYINSMIDWIEKNHKKSTEKTIQITYKKPVKAIIYNEHLLDSI